MKRALFLLVSVLLPFMLWAQQERMMFGDTSRVGVPYSKDPHVINFNGTYYMYYSIPPKNWSKTEGWGVGVATSTDLVNWNRVGEITTASVGNPDMKGMCAPCALVLEGKVHLFYQSYGSGKRDAICHAVSSDGVRFVADRSNPIYRPEEADWTCGRAIDAEVTKYKGRYFLYFATRDPAYKIQQQGVAVAKGDTDFSAGSWTTACDKPILAPVYDWEGLCIEGASICYKGKKMYMFYAGSYNNDPQQIGVAVSSDGIHWKRLSADPFKRNGKPGEWNSSESGHPHLFTDVDGRTYLFYQGNNDKGKTWYITQEEVLWKHGKPYLKSEQ